MLLGLFLAFFSQRPILLMADLQAGCRGITAAGVFLNAAGAGAGHAHEEVKGSG